MIPLPFQKYSICWVYCQFSPKLYLYLYLCICICVFVFACLTPGNIVFGVLVPRASQKYSTCMIFTEFTWLTLWAGRRAHSASLVNRASSLNTFAGHGPLAQHCFWRSGPGTRVVRGASSPNTFAGQTPPLVTRLRRHFSEELYLTWALLGYAPQRLCPGVNSSLCEEWECRG